MSTEPEPVRLFALLPEKKIGRVLRSRKVLASTLPSSPSADKVKPYFGMGKIISLAVLLLPLLSLLSLLTGCLGGGPLVEVAVIDERTALENQILGSYQELDKEVLLLASVRAIDKTGKLVKRPRVPPGKRAVIRAVQRSAFNRDDVDLLKHRGALGENRSGLLTILDEESIPEGEGAFVQNLVGEENSDRKIIMQRLIDINENLSDGNMADIQNIFASLNRDRALKGDMIETSEGKWVRKE